MRGKNNNKLFQFTKAGESEEEQKLPSHIHTHIINNVKQMHLE